MGEARPGSGRQADQGHVRWSPPLSFAPFSAALGPRKVGRPSPQGVGGTAPPSLGQAPPVLALRRQRKSRVPPHLSPDPPSTLLNLCKWTEQKKMESDVCHHTGVLVSGPKHNSVPRCARRAGVRSLLSGPRPRQRAPAPDRPGADRLRAQGVPPGSRKGRSSSVGGPAYRFHFEETKNWGNGLPVSAVSWNDAWAGRGAGGGGGGESQRPDPRGGHATLTCRGRGTVFNISAGVSPFKLSSGVVLHKVLPTCSFFCMYNCLFIKGFEVLSQ